MPYDLEVEPEGRFACLIGRGSTDPDEGHAILVAMAAHPDFRPGFGLVCDLREMQYEPTTEEMMAGFQNVIRFKPLLRSRIAFVVGPAMELQSEVAAALYATQGFDAQVFWVLEEAVAWVKEACASHSVA